MLLLLLLLMLVVAMLVARLVRITRSSDVTLRLATDYHTVIHSSAGQHMSTDPAVSAHVKVSDALIAQIATACSLRHTKRTCAENYNLFYFIYYLLHRKVAHREYNMRQQNAKTLKQYDAKMHKRVSAIKIYKYT